jgi:hypothetical protein
MQCLVRSAAAHFPAKRIYLRLTATYPNPPRYALQNQLIARYRSLVLSKAGAGPVDHSQSPEAVIQRPDGA